MFTKRQFELIADILRTHVVAWDETRSLDTTSAICHSVVRSIAHDFALLFASDNPRFDTERFMKACGLEESEDSSESHDG